jgi:putative SOS response-associated peptidase YedK
VTAPGNGNTRRPLVLAEADAEAWLDVRGASHAAAVDLLRRVSARPISLVTVEYGP